MVMVNELFLTKRKHLGLFLSPKRLRHTHIVRSKARPPITTFLPLPALCKPDSRTVHLKLTLSMAEVFHVDRGSCEIYLQKEITPLTWLTSLH